MYGKRLVNELFTFKRILTLNIRISMYRKNVVEKVSERIWNFPAYKLRSSN